MYWLSLFCVEAGGTTWLFYGYATPVDGFPVGSWNVREVGRINGGVELIQASRFADTQTLDAFRGSFVQAQTELQNNGQTVRSIRHGGLRERPSVFANPKTFVAEGSPASFSDQLAQVDAHWQLAPQSLVTGLHSHPQLPIEEREECLARVLTWIENETGIDFTGQDSGRLGNFEVVSYLIGNYDQPDGLCHRPEPTSPEGGAGVVVWIEPPLAACAPLRVGCRLYNGHPSDLRTLIADELRIWPSPDTAPLRFVAREPISSYELSVWTEDGRLLARQTPWVFRELRGDISISPGGRAVSTPWDQRLPVPLQQHVFESTGATRQPLQVGGYDLDPWVTVDDRKRVLLNELGLATGSGRHFPAGQEHHVKTILFLARLMTRRGVRRVVLADPYLDSAAVESLLVRIQSVPELVIIISHDQSEAVEKPASVDPIPKLAEHCDQYRADLPRRMRVINLHSSEGGKGRQFHDRMLLIEHKEEGRELWSLTNSVSMLARRFPITIAKMDASVARSVAEYIRQLEAGELPGRNDLSATLVWDNPPPRPVAAQAAKSSHPSSQQWQDQVLGFLVCEVAVSGRLQATLDRQILEAEARPGTTTWRLTPGAKERVLESIADQVHSQETDISFVRAIATWAYNGGPQASELWFDNRAITILEAAIRQSLHATLASASPYNRTSLDMTSDESAPEALDSVRIYVNQHTHGDLFRGVVPDLDFLCETLWRLAPERLIAVEEETRTSRIAGWLVTNAVGLSDGQVRAILVSRIGRLRALGVVITWYRDMDRHPPADAPQEEAPLDRLANKLFQVGVSSAETAQLCVALVLPGIGTVDSFREQATAIVARHAGPFGQDNLQRIISLLGINGGLHPVVRVNAFAAVCLDSNDQRELSEWCVAEVVKYLPRRGHSLPSRVSDAPRPSDAEVRTGFAQSLWRVHGEHAPAWYESNVVNSLDLNGVNLPLYRTRNYQEWSHHLEGLLRGLRLGIPVVDEASPAQRAAAFALLFPLLRNRLAAFRPGLWHHFLDLEDSLANLVDTLARWTDDPIATENDVDAVDQAFARQEIPGIWRLRAVLGSQRLTQRHLPELMSWAVSPGSSGSILSMPRHESFLQPIKRHLAALKMAIPQSVDQFDAVEVTLDAWWSRFT